MLMHTCTANLQFFLRGKKICRGSKECMDKAYYCNTKEAIKSVKECTLDALTPYIFINYI